MNITVFGAGHVGLVAAGCFSRAGHRVVCADVDIQRLQALQLRTLHVDEPGLQERLDDGVRLGNLQFTNDIEAAVRHAVLCVVAVPTLSNEDGSAGTSVVFDVADSIARYAEGVQVLAVKSTVPVGTSQQLQTRIDDLLTRRGSTARTVVTSNPEFLAEGTAVRDFEEPARIVVGLPADPQAGPARAILREAYEPFLGRSVHWMEMDLSSSELSKYAANMLLAARVSLVNELSLLAEAVGADIEHIRNVAGADPRIGPAHLRAGPGFGGSCLPKDLRALVHAGQARGVPMHLVAATLKVNEAQKQRLVEKLARRWGSNFQDRSVAVWGLSFKPGTADMREAPSRVFIRQLLEQGARVRASDPIAISAAYDAISTDAGMEAMDRVTFHEDPLDALRAVDALVLMTDWPEYSAFSPHDIRVRMGYPLIIDGRNALDAAAIRSAGIEYEGIGRGYAKGNYH